MPYLKTRYIKKGDQWENVWKPHVTPYKRIDPKLIPAHTKFGSGQTLGKTTCGWCGKQITRNSGQQKYCGPYQSKDSCARRAYLQTCKVRYAEKKKGKKFIAKGLIMRKLETGQIIHYIRNKTGKPSPILMCSCGLLYIQTRFGQEKCVPCLSANNESYTKNPLFVCAIGDQNL